MIVARMQQGAAQHLHQVHSRTIVRRTMTPRSELGRDHGPSRGVPSKNVGTPERQIAFVRGNPDAAVVSALVVMIDGFIYSDIDHERGKSISEGGILFIPFPQEQPASQHLITLLAEKFRKESLLRG